jgi:hypothetical protein
MKLGSYDPSLNSTRRPQLNKNKKLEKKEKKIQEKLKEWRT